MLGFVARRFAAALVLVWLVLTGTFFLIHAAPGEPSLLYEDARMTEEGRQRLRALYGWDRPPVEQYARWLGAVMQGDWGTSISFRRPAMAVLLERLPATALLVLAGVALEHLLGIAIGIALARRAGSFVDRQARWLGLLLLSFPSFVLAIVAIELFAVRWPIFPPQQMTSDGHLQMSAWGKLLDVLHHLALPVLVLGCLRAGAVMRFVRNGLLDQLSREYVLTARAKGLSEARVLWVHALPNAVGPLIQRLGVSLPVLLSGSIIFEVIFAWPGIGLLTYNAILSRDYPLIMASTALGALLVVAGSLLADLLHGWLDPRVRERHA